MCLCGTNRGAKLIDLVGKVKWKPIHWRIACNCDYLRFVLLLAYCVSCDIGQPSVGPKRVRPYDVVLRARRDGSEDKSINKVIERSSRVRFSEYVRVSWMPHAFASWVQLFLTSITLLGVVSRGFDTE